MFIRTWTNTFVKALKSVVKNHALAEDVNEPESINRRTVENVIVQVFINVSNLNEFSQCMTSTLQIISASGYCDCCAFFFFFLVRKKNGEIFYRRCTGLS